MKQLENERDYYRNECNCLKQKDENSNKDNVRLVFWNFFIYKNVR